MVLSQKLKVAFYLPPSMEGYKTIEEYLESKYDPDFRIFRMISEALSFNYEAVTYKILSNLTIPPNTSWTGSIGMVNRSEVDMIPELFLVTEQRKDAVHFTYPFRLYATTFVIKKPEYSPQKFGIINVFPSSVWLTIGLFAIAMSIIKSLLMKKKHTLPDTMFDVFAICLKQPTVIKSWTLSENLLTYSWMVGVMFLGFCYTSVLLSFLTFPTNFKIKDIKDLAHAVENHGYKCMFDFYVTAGPTMMAKSELKPLAIVGENMLANPNVFGSLEDFFRMKMEKVAFFIKKEAIPHLPDNYFVSDDNILEVMPAMIVRKDFPCKEQLDMIIHRIMAAGIYTKVKQDKVFLSSNFEFGDADAQFERKLTLKDFTLAFMMLLMGHALSVIVLVYEVVVGFRKAVTLKIK